VLGAYGNAPPSGRWLAALDPNLIDSTGDFQGLSTWSTSRADAIKFPTRDAAQECMDAVPANAPRRMDGTANRVLDRYRMLIEHVTPEPAKPRMSLLDEMRLDGTF
jgi:hypothetical protein